MVYPKLGLGVVAVALLCFACGDDAVEEEADGSNGTLVGGDGTTNTSNGVAASNGATSTGNGTTNVMDSTTGDITSDMCPPAGPFGTDVGKTLPDVELPDCDGNMHRLYDLCANKASWIFEYATWCPYCRDFVSGRGIDSVQEVYDQFKDEDFGMFFVVSQTNNYDFPNAQFCKDIRAQHGLTMTVLYDPDGRLSRTLEIPVFDINLVMREGSVLLWKDQHANGDVPAQIESALRP